MDWIVPKRLHKGMTLAFLAPASACQEDLDLVKAICQERGYQAIFSPSCYGQGLDGGSEEEMVKKLIVYLGILPSMPLFVPVVGMGQCDT